MDVNKKYDRSHPSLPHPLATSTFFLCRMRGNIIFGLIRDLGSRSPKAVPNKPGGGFRVGDVPQAHLPSPMAAYLSPSSSLRASSTASASPHTTRWRRPPGSAGTGRTKAPVRRSASAARASAGGRDRALQAGGGGGGGTGWYWGSGGVLGYMLGVDSDQQFFDLPTPALRPINQTRSCKPRGVMCGGG